MRECYMRAVNMLWSRIWNKKPIRYTLFARFIKNVFLFSRISYFFISAHTRSKGFYNAYMSRYNIACHCCLTENMTSQDRGDNLLSIYDIKKGIEKKLHDVINEWALWWLSNARMKSSIINIPFFHRSSRNELWIKMFFNLRSPFNCHSESNWKA